MDLKALKIAAAKAAAKTGKVAAERRAEERADIASAIRDHSGVGDGYWKARFKADRINDAAQKLSDALNEIEDEGEGR